MVVLPAARGAARLAGLQTPIERTSVCAGTRSSFAPYQQRRQSLSTLRTCSGLRMPCMTFRRSCTLDARPSQGLLPIVVFSTEPPPRWAVRNGIADEAIIPSPPEFSFALSSSFCYLVETVLLLRPFPAGRFRSQGRLSMHTIGRLIAVFSRFPGFSRRIRPGRDDR